MLKRTLKIRWGGILVKKSSGWGSLEDKNPTATRFNKKEAAVWAGGKEESGEDLAWEWDLKS